MRRTAAAISILAVLGFTGGAHAQPRPRALAPVPMQECDDLLRAVQPAVPRPFRRSAGEVRFFSGTLDVRGPGCVLTARGMLNQFDGDGVYWETLKARLVRVGWRADPGMVADGGGGQVLGYRRGDRYLAVSFEEDDGGMCDPDAPADADDCDLPPERTRVTVQLGLARAAPAPRRR